MGGWVGGVREKRERDRNRGNRRGAESQSEGVWEGRRRNRFFLVSEAMEKGLESRIIVRLCRRPQSRRRRHSHLCGWVGGWVRVFARVLVRVRVRA